MRVLVLSDIHSNLPALRAVLSATQRKRFDAVFCLGDIVGYGAHPNQVVERLRRLRAPLVAIRGNHDRAVAAEEEPAGFNYAAREAVVWTRTRLAPANRHFIRALREGPVADRGVTLCHGSPVDEDEYLFGGPDVLQALSAVTTDLALCGHTHVPMVFRVRPHGEVDVMLVRGDATLRFEQGSRYLVNPGSVGQPRDRDPRAAYAIVDLTRGAVHFRRVSYDVAAAQEAILGAGLPEVLAHRLGGGF
ncbi:MAG: metallophosphoesterase family protein [Thermoanaerobaculia bacterium]